MARSEARLSVQIWSDEDFRALTPGAQWLYMFLLSQPDLSYLGIIALRERRWARSASGMTPEGIAEGIAELSAERFVVVDPDTEEVLIRSLIRRDGVYRQPNLLRAAEKELPLVESYTIRAAIGAELRRVAASDDVPAGSANALTRMIDALPNPSPNPSPEGSPDPTPNPSPRTIGVRGVVTAVRSDSPKPLNPKIPEPTPPAPSARNTRVRAIARASPDFDRFWDTYPRKEAKGAARRAWDKAIKTTNPDQIIAAAARYRDQPGREPRYTAHPATWLNAERWTDQPTAQPAHANGHRPYQDPADTSAYYGDL